MVIILIVNHNKLVTCQVVVKSLCFEPAAGTASLPITCNAAEIAPTSTSTSISWSTYRHQHSRITAAAAGFIF